MDTRKIKIYTKTGDKGKTSLVGGQRVNKFDIRIESYGQVDELNSFIGLLMAEGLEQRDYDFLLWIQQKLLSMGGYLATDTTKDEVHETCIITQNAVTKIEKEIDRLEADLKPMTAFILPSGPKTTAIAHVCRTVCRRLERAMFRLNEETPLDTNALTFINRLSDYLFSLSRHETLRLENGKEIIWTYSKD